LSFTFTMSSFLANTIRRGTADASRARAFEHKLSSQLPYSASCPGAARRRTFTSTPRRRVSDAPRPPEGRGEGSEANHSSSQGKSGKEKGAHALFYRDMLPAMIPVALLGSAVYLGLKLLQNQLATEKALDEADAKIAALELRVEELVQQRDERMRAAETKLPPIIDGQKSSRWWFAQA